MLRSVPSIISSITDEFFGQEPAGRRFSLGRREPMPFWKLATLAAERLPEGGLVVGGLFLYGCGHHSCKYTMRPDFSEMHLSLFD